MKNKVTSGFCNLSKKQNNKIRLASQNNTNVFECQQKQIVISVCCLVPVNNFTFKVHLGNKRFTYLKIFYSYKLHNLIINCTLFYNEKLHGLGNESIVILRVYFQWVADGFMSFIHCSLSLVNKKKSSVKSENLALLLSLIPLERDKKKKAQVTLHTVHRPIN